MHFLRLRLSRLVPLKSRATKSLSPFSLRTPTLTHPHPNIHNRSLSHSLQHAIITIITQQPLARCPWSIAFTPLGPASLRIHHPSALTPDASLSQLHAPQAWETRPATTTRIRSLLRRRLKTQSRRARRLLPVTPTLACKSTSSHFTALTALTASPPVST